MSLSTSNFRNELKVIGVVLLALLSCEIVIRTQEESLSKDVQHIRQIPAISKSLVEGDGLRVLFLGNSMLREGVKPDILKRDMAAQGIEPLHIERVYPDATALVDWYYAFKHYFVDTNRLPNTLIVCFAGRDLEDNHPVQALRLARYYTSVSDTPSVFANDIRDFESRAEFLLADALASFANRTRVRERLLDLVIPNYRETARRINQNIQVAENNRSAKTPPTYHRLERLISLAQKSNVQFVLVAMPQQYTYPLDQQIQRTVEAAGMNFVDGRMVEGLNGEKYIDEMHLNSNGADVYSHALAQRLAEHIERMSGGASPALSGK